jgi:tRNA U38,U39,U40 pseudouridine synthase TruA
MVRVVAKCANGTLTTDTIKHMLNYPHPDTFTNLKLTAAPPHGLYLVDCVYDPKQFVDPVPYCLHGWDNPYEEIEATEEEKRKDRMLHFWA